MSPRSHELLRTARDRLAGAEKTLRAGYAEGAASSAYYAMLYAVRAALSEEDRYAKTHAGTWSAFGEAFVAQGRFAAGLAADARRVQRLREAGDYDAREISEDEAREAVATARRFVTAVGELLDG
jgi:uncharacterized protein (UPF0332 family)